MISNRHSDITYIPKGRLKWWPMNWKQIENSEERFSAGFTRSSPHLYIYIININRWHLWICQCMFMFGWSMKLKCLWWFSTSLTAGYYVQDTLQDPWHPPQANTEDLSHMCQCWRWVCHSPSDQHSYTWWRNRRYINENVKMPSSLQVFKSKARWALIQT